MHVATFAAPYSFPRGMLIQKCRYEIDAIFLMIDFNNFKV